MAIIETKLLIIGAGPAGLTAGIYAARANLQPILLAGLQPGGQLTITTDVENYPGFAEVIQGPWLMEQMVKQAEHCGVDIRYDSVVNVDFSQKIKILTTDSGDTYHAKSVIIATGAEAKWLGEPSETKFRGYGVSACATCDGFFFRGQEVVVFGGGNTAVEEALYLTNHASKVTIIHRREQFKSEKILQDRLHKNPKIATRMNHEFVEILGTDNPLSVSGVMVKDKQTGKNETIPCTGVFIAIGHAPATHIFKGALDMNEYGYIKVKAGTVQTSVPGVFAAGDVADPIYRQAVTSAGFGCMAALDADRYLAEHDE